VTAERGVGGKKKKRWDMEEQVRSRATGGGKEQQSNLEFYKDTGGYRAWSAAESSTKKFSTIVSKKGLQKKNGGKRKRKRKWGGKND